MSLSSLNLLLLHITELWLRSSSCLKSQPNQTVRDRKKGFRPRIRDKRRQPKCFTVRVEVTTHWRRLSRVNFHFFVKGLWELFKRNCSDRSWHRIRSKDLVSNRFLILMRILCIEDHSLGTYIFTFTPREPFSLYL